MIKPIKTVKKKAIPSVSGNQAKSNCLKKTKPEVVDLPTVLDIASAGDFLAAVRAATEKSNRLELVAAQVERITTPGLQIILSAAKTLEQAGGALTLKAPSGAVRQVFEDLGFSEQLKAWSV